MHRPRADCGPGTHSLYLAMIYIGCMRSKNKQKNLMVLEVGFYNQLLQRCEHRDGRAHGVALGYHIHMRNEEPYDLSQARHLLAHTSYMFPPPSGTDPPESSRQPSAVPTGTSNGT